MKCNLAGAAFADRHFKRSGRRALPPPSRRPLWGIQILKIAGWNEAEDWRAALESVDVPIYNHAWRTLFACLRYRQ